jgi:hypothetical protein
MSDISYHEDFSADDFLALAQRVWPRDYSSTQAAAALARTINIGVWDGSRLVGSIRVLTDGYFFATYLKFSSTRHTNVAASVGI